MRRTGGDTARPPHLLAGVRSAPPLHDVRDVLVAEVAEGREDRVRRGLSQPAQRTFLDGLAQLLEPVDVFQLTFALRAARAGVAHVPSAAPARGALPAGLVHDELGADA